MSFGLVTKNMVFRYTANVNVKKDVRKDSKDKTGGKEKEDETTVEGNESKPWMGAL